MKLAPWAKLTDLIQWGYTGLSFAYYLLIVSKCISVQFIILYTHMDSSDGVNVQGTTRHTHIDETSALNLCAA